MQALQLARLTFVSTEKVVLSTPLETPWSVAPGQVLQWWRQSLVLQLQHAIYKHPELACYARVVSCETTLHHQEYTLELLYGTAMLGDIALQGIPPWLYLQLRHQFSESPSPLLWWLGDTPHHTLGYEQTSLPLLPFLWTPGLHYLALPALERPDVHHPRYTSWNVHHAPQWSFGLFLERLKQYPPDVPAQVLLDLAHDGPSRYHVYSQTHYLLGHHGGHFFVPWLRGERLPPDWLSDDPHTCFLTQPFEKMQGHRPLKTLETYHIGAGGASSYHVSLQLDILTAWVRQACLSLPEGSIVMVVVPGWETLLKNLGIHHDHGMPSGLHAHERVQGLIASWQQLARQEKICLVMVSLTPDTPSMLQQGDGHHWRGWFDQGIILSHKQEVLYWSQLQEHYVLSWSLHHPNRGLVPLVHTEMPQTQTPKQTPIEAEPVSVRTVPDSKLVDDALLSNSMPLSEAPLPVMFEEDEPPVQISQPYTEAAFNEPTPLDLIEEHALLDDETLYDEPIFMSQSEVGSLDETLDIQETAQTAETEVIALTEAHHHAPEVFVSEDTPSEVLEASYPEGSMMPPWCFPMLPLSWQWTTWYGFRHQAGLPVPSIEEMFEMLAIAQRRRQQQYAVYGVSHHEAFPPQPVSHTVVTDVTEINTPAVVAMEEPQAVLPHTEPLWVEAPPLQVASHPLPPLPPSPSVLEGASSDDMAPVFEPDALFQFLDPENSELRIGDSHPEVTLGDEKTYPEVDPTRVEVSLSSVDTSTIEEKVDDPFSFVEEDLNDTSASYPPASPTQAYPSPTQPLTSQASSGHSSPQAAEGGVPSRNAMPMVWHPQYGQGTCLKVIELPERTVYRVAFPEPIGVRLLDAATTGLKVQF
jgi:hypothetical protein